MTPNQRCKALFPDDRKGLPADRVLQDPNLFRSWLYWNGEAPREPLDEALRESLRCHVLRPRIRTAIARFLMKTKRLVLSTSQLDRFDLCARKWWFRYGPLKLKEPRGSSEGRLFGDVLHNVCERWLRADDTGRDEAGRPVELYPKGWEQPVDRYGKKPPEPLRLELQQIVKALVSSAIENGTLERAPGRRVEQPFSLRLEEFCSDELTVVIEGYRDLVEPEHNRIVDHKGVKRWKYHHGSKRLAKNRQLLTYAYATLFEKHERGEPLPETFTVRHNHFCRDPEDLRASFSEAEVSVRQIQDVWQGNMELVRQLLDVRKIETWHKTPEPKNRNRACRAFGGCPYFDICGGLESPQQFKKRIDGVLARAVGSKPSATPLPLLGDPSPMSFEKMLAAKRAALQHATAAPKAADTAEVNPKLPDSPAAKPEKEPEAPPPPQQKPPEEPKDDGKPPWAHADCTACEGDGFNSKKSPCRICDTLQQRDGGPRISNYVVMVLDDGSAVWEEKKTKKKVAKKKTKKPQKQKPDVAPEPPKAEEQKKPEPRPPADPLRTPSAASAGSAGRKPVGRPPKQFTLMINVACTKGLARKKGQDKRVVYLDEVLQRWGERMASENSVASYYELNAFQRRDALAQHVRLLVEEFKGCHVMARSGQSPDLDHLLTAIRPFAGVIYESTL